MSVTRGWLVLVVTVVVAGFVGGSMVTHAQPAVAKSGVDEEIRKLLSDRREVLQRLVRVQLEKYQPGRIDLRAIADARRQLLSVELKLNPGRAERVKLLTESLALEKEVEKVVQARHQVGQVGLSDVLQAQALRMQVETQLLRAKRK